MKHYYTFIVMILVIMCGCSKGNDNHISGKDISQEQAIDMKCEIIEALNIKEITDKDYPNYPETFGGMYYQDNTLYICITNETDEAKEQYINIVSEPEGIDFKVVKYSYNQLYTTMLDVSDNNYDNVISVSVIDQDNKVEVALEYEKSEDEINSVKDIILNDFSEKKDMLVFVQERACSPAVD